MKVTLVLIFFALTSYPTLAQDFDADSIHYTPLSKEVNRIKKGQPYKFPKDTITEKRFIRYFFSFQTASMIGCTDCNSWKEVTLSLSTLHGLSLGKRLRAGAGVGLDFYDQWTTLPVFGSISFDIVGTRNKNAVFIQANYGWAHAWRKEGLDFGNGVADIAGGPMMSGQMGYRIRYRDLTISIALGPKTQRVYSYFETPTFYLNPEGVVIEGEANKMTVKQDLNRFVISLALGWK